MNDLNLRREIFMALLALVFVMVLPLTTASIVLNVQMERERLDQNLNNIALTLAHSESVHTLLLESTEGTGGNRSSQSSLAIHALQDTLSDVDVISIVDTDGIRAYHTNERLKGSIYDGSPPRFDGEASDDTGPSGSQRRAYAAVYDGQGRYLGFVLAVLLNENIYRIIGSAVLIHLFCAAAALLLAGVLSRKLSSRIKNLLRGYEPDVFGDMFSLRENILDSLEEGIWEMDGGKTVYRNRAASVMLGEEVPEPYLHTALQRGERQTGVSFRTRSGAEILADIIPTGGERRLCILRDRTEYTRLMEDLTGVRYLVDAMRANNHDFTNKLHVLLGLLEMGETERARAYITVTVAIQQELIRRIVRSIEDTSVAALLIGKYARAAELDIRFTLEPGSRLSRSDILLPSGDLVTILGNLIDNAMDAMNMNETENEKTLTVGIFTTPHAMLFSVDDTGPGIASENLESVFEQGFSTKGADRGTGLYQVRLLAQKYGGSVTVESEVGEGASFTVTLTDEGGAEHV